MKQSLHDRAKYSKKEPSKGPPYPVQAQFRVLLLEEERKTKYIYIFFLPEEELRIVLVLGKRVPLRALSSST